MEQQFGRREERLPEPQSKIEEKIYDITKVRMRIGSLSEIIHFTFILIEPVLSSEWIRPPVRIRVRSLVSDGTK